MRQLQPVIWAKGTFLTPQHLQIQDRFFESILEFKLNALRYCPWGFRELQFDREALAAGNLAIIRAVGLFPDGLAFDVPDSDPAPGGVPIKELFGPDQDTLDVYLSIPQMQHSGINVSVAQKDADTRYLAEVSLLRDENSGLAEKPVQIARKNLRLVVGGETRQGSSMLRAARIKKTPAGTLELDSLFVPPLLDVAASDHLTAILRRLLEIVSAKSSTLAGTRRQRKQTLADFTTADISNFWLLYTVNSSLPLLRHYFETRRGHPEELYELLISLAGSLSTFSSNIQPRDFPLYDHNNLGGCYTELDEKLRTLLETVVPSNFVSLPLKLTQQCVYATAIANEKYLVNTRLYLAISSDLKAGDLIAKVPQLVKVCSATHLETLIRQALPGMNLLHVPSPPGTIPIKLNYQYFSLNQSGAAWEAVTRARNLAAYVPGDIPNPQMELIILLPQAE